LRKRYAENNGPSSYSPKARVFRRLGELWSLRKKQQVGGNKTVAAETLNLTRRTRGVVRGRLKSRADCGGLGARGQQKGRGHGGSRFFRNSRNGGGVREPRPEKRGMKAFQNEIIGRGGEIRVRYIVKEA